MRTQKQEQQPVSGDVGGSVFTEGGGQQSQYLVTPRDVGQCPLLEQTTEPLVRKGLTRVSSLADLVRGMLANLSIGPERE